MKVYSEIGQLKTLLVHRPGKELEHLMPQYLDEMLFEDIPFLQQMQEEHDYFVQVLQDQGVEVVYFQDLLSQILDGQETKAQVVETILNQIHLADGSTKDRLIDHLSSQSSEALAETLIAGIPKSDIAKPSDSLSLSDIIVHGYPFYLEPIANLYFSRDYGSMIGNRFSVNTMKARARVRESWLMQQIFDHHPRFQQCESWHRWDEHDPLEGGDILVLSPQVLAIGCSARTSPEAIEKLAKGIFSSDEPFTTVLVVQLPFTRAYMHLDTVFTMVDRNRFTIFPGIEQRITIYTLQPSSQGQLRIREHEDLRTVLEELLGLDRVQFIRTGGGNVLAAEREQWNDGTNTLSVAPGVVLGYRRNTVSNRLLEDHGIQVLSIPGSELVRGRGGPRCMSMPLDRAALPE